MKYFLVKILKIVGAYLLAFVIISTVLEYLIYQNTQQKQYLLQDDWDTKVNMNYDILFIGNSRVWSQVNSEMVAKTLNQKVYNLAQDGRGIDLLWAKFKQYVKYNTPPKQIYLLFDPYFLEGRNDNTFYGKENYLKYLFYDRLGVNHLFKNEKGFHDYETYIPLVRYIGYRDLFFEHVLGKAPKDTTRTKNITYGINIFNFKWNQENIANKSWDGPPRTNLKLIRISYVDSFKNYCNKHQIKLHLFYPPQSWPSYKAVTDSTKQILNDFANKSGLDFVNFNDVSYNDSTLFYNHMHLNKKGSTIFSKQLIQHYFNK